MHILLLSMPTPHNPSRVQIVPPMSLLCVGGMLRKEGHTSEILNLDLLTRVGLTTEEAKIEHVVKRLETGEFDVLGLNCLVSSQFPFARKLTEAVRARALKLPTILGGMHATLFAQDILTKCPSFDYIILGEGERQTSRLMRHIQSPTDAVLANIDGIAWRNASGTVHVNKRMSPLAPAEMPAPAWDMLRIDDYRSDYSKWYNPKGNNITLVAPLYTSRSCPLDCTFCSAFHMMGRGLRLRRIQDIFDEIEYLYHEHCINYFSIFDDNFTLNKQHVMQFCDEIRKRNLNIQFDSSSGFNIAALDEHMMAAMAEAGCIHFPMPIESGNDNIRQNVIHKKLPREKIFEIARLAKKHNMLTTGMFIIGFPEDTPETLEDTRRMILELELDKYHVYTLIPFPGTKIFKQALKDNLFTESIDLSKLWDGTFNFEKPQGDFALKPYNCSLDTLRKYKHEFGQYWFFSDRVKALQKQHSSGTP
ncbi:B12-binding domain-containing radical SAM protein [Fundidesulfovibrio soli]|uniref:B12-binding domain-containing radical SAM protein n=1 Tax=Fundidesulfovibrio soli TaxID=2922716 RepID=UPI001FAF1353|nr:radical SAM protein [Fundidesulfovibrio soli]